jgi:hypothetical protein
VSCDSSLHGDRQAIPDVPAIYFVSPTRENVQRIARDCVAKLYDSVHLNFSSAIPRPLLEELADTTLEADATSRIAKVRLVTRHTHRRTRRTR